MAPPRLILLFDKQNMNLRHTAIHPRPSGAEKFGASRTRNLLWGSTLHFLYLPGMSGRRPWVMADRVEDPFIRASLKIQSPFHSQPLVRPIANIGRLIFSLAENSPFTTKGWSRNKLQLNHLNALLSWQSRARWKRGTHGTLTLLLSQEINCLSRFFPPTAR